MWRRDCITLGCATFAGAFGTVPSRRLDLSGYELSFTTEFDKTQRPLFTSDGGPFSTCFEEWGGLRTLPGNKEAELYVDPSFMPSPHGTDALGRSDARPGAPIKPLGVNPFL